VLTRLLAWLSPPTAGAVRGRIIARDTVEGPLSGVRCVYARRILEQQSHVGDDPLARHADWHVTGVTEDVAEFYLGVDGGRVLVAPFDLDVVIDDRYATRVQLAADLRATELALVPGDEIEVIGERGEVADPFSEAPDARGATTIAALRAPEGGRLRVTLVARR
jgi:hypothetical protein